MGPSGGDELPLIPRGWRASWLELLTRCWLALGRVDEAGRSARLAREAAAASELRLALALADRASAAVALDTDPSRAAELARASATAAESVGARIEAALEPSPAARSRRPIESKRRSRNSFGRRPSSMTAVQSGIAQPRNESCVTSGIAFIDARVPAVAR